MPPISTLLAAVVALVGPAEPEGPRPAEDPEAPAPARARPAPVDRPPCGCRYGGDHKRHTRNLFGAKFYNVNIFERGARDEAGEPIPGAEGQVTIYSMFGAGIFYERELIRDWLEIELNVLILTDSRATIVPFELYLKKPFHVHRRMTPYIGVGPTLDLLFEDQRPRPFFGISAAVGSYFWLTPRFGFDVDLGYTLVFERAVAHELNVGVGPVVHF